MLLLLLFLFNQRDSFNNKNIGETEAYNPQHLLCRVIHKSEFSIVLIKKQKLKKEKKKERKETPRIYRRQILTIESSMFRDENIYEKRE